MTRIALFSRPHQLPGGDLRSVLEVGRAADRAGLHSIHFGEHLLVGPRTDAYPYGPFVHDDATPWPDPITTLAAVAAVTERVRLATGVVLAPLRPAAVLAKAVATLDVLSGGRVELGVGTGWQREEYDAVGVPWKERHDRLAEGIAACRALWGEQPVTFRGRFTDVEGCWALPRPVQARVPVLFGVRMTAASAARIADLGDGWCPVGLQLDELRHGIALLAAAFEAAGRDPATMVVRNRPPQPLDAHGRIDIDRTLAAAAPEVAAGVNVVAVGPPVGIDSLAGVAEFVERLGEKAAGLP